MIERPTVRHAAGRVYHAQRIKRLVRMHLGEGVQCMVSVRETVCADPECEGPATTIRILLVDFREIRTVIHKALRDVGAPDVYSSLSES